MTTGQPASGFRYWAFISYSHTDASWGRWLHKALETYRVPRRLVGMPIAAGTVPARLTPIFRDRDELPTTSDLGAAVEEALGQSWCLIVICSPESARSRWVNEEVLAFQRLGRGDRIHCLIVDGGPDPAAPLCFPPSLEHAQSSTGNGKSEPVAADARRFADGRSHALLKLIAGILGIGYDTLVQREQQRRHRNMFWVTCASLALVIVLGVATLVALTSRREAVDQRSHAEGLVEFMIGDLRKKLEPDGKLATLDAVGKEALAYYAAQKSEDLDAEGLARRARALHMIGEVYDLRGELDEALKVFEQAAESTAELVAREPDNGQRIFDHAQSVYWVGYIAYQRGNIAIAEPAFQEYKRLAERLVELDPKNEDWQAEVGYANSNVGTLLFQLGRFKEAALLFSRELEMAEQFSNRAPTEYVRQLRYAQAHAWLADVLRGQGSYSEAAGHRQKEVAIYRNALTINPNNNDAKEALLVSEHHRAVIEHTLGNSSAALSHIVSAVNLGRDLIELDPENTRWTEIAAAAYTTQSTYLFYAGDLTAARASGETASSLVAGLLKRDKQVRTWKFRWAATNMIEARISAASGNEPDAVRKLETTATALSEMTPDQSSDWERTSTLIRTFGLLGEIHATAGASGRASKAWEVVVDLAQKNVGPRDPIVQAELAVALLALGRKEQAAPILDWLAAIEYREPGYLERIGPMAPKFLSSSN